MLEQKNGSETDGRPNLKPATWIRGLIALILLLPAAAAAQSLPISNPGLDGANDTAPDGWAYMPATGLPPGFVARISTASAQSGETSVRLTAPADPQPGQFAALSQALDAQRLRGKRVRFRSAVRNVGDGGGRVGLWLRVDRRGGVAFFDNMADRPIPIGDWAYFDVTGDVASDATAVNFGFLISGVADAYFDSASLEVVGDAPVPDVSESEAVAAWIRTAAQPLAATAIGASRRDLQGFSAMVGPARIVSLGEATHGSREQFEIKGRLVEHLVESEGFTAFAIEASYADTLAVNRYVLTGEGDLNAVVAGMGFWTWSTEEVANLIEWIRRHNATAAADRKVRVYGFDAQPLMSPLSSAMDYLDRAGHPMEPAARAEVSDLVRRFEDQWRRLGASPGTSDLTTLSRVAAALGDHFDANRAALASNSAPGEFEAYRQAATAFAQAIEIHLSRGDTSRGPYTRDRFMADNVDWILRQEGEAGRVVLWAHNGHVTQGGSADRVMMGGELERRHGEAHVAVGFFFGAGGFQAIGPSAGGARQTLRPFAVGPVGAEDLEGVMTGTDLANYYMDIRASREDGLVWNWFSRPQPSRWYGSVYRPEQGSAANRSVVLAQEFDIAVFTLATTPARPLPR